MKKHLIGLFVILFFAFAVSAQTVEKTLEKIRAVYNEASEKAAAAEQDDDKGQYGDLVMNELVINKRRHQWRAVGIYGINYKFFYRGGDSEAHLYPDELVLVKVQKDISSRTYLEEFLYDKNGALIFYFQKASGDDQVPAERRIYFSLGRAIRITEDGKKRDKLTVKDAATVKDIMQSSAGIKEIFTKSIKL